MALLFWLMGWDYNIKSYKPQFNPCKADRSVVKYENRVEFAIGCSTVNGRRVYYRTKLLRLYYEK